MRLTPFFLVIVRILTHLYYFIHINQHNVFQLLGDRRDQIFREILIAYLERKIAYIEKKSREKICF